MSYLDRLRGGDAGKRTPSVLQEPQKGPPDSGKRPPCELQKPQKGPSYSFCSSHGDHFQKSDPAAPCTTCSCGSFWRGESGAWRCEQCEPPGNAKVAAWRNFGGGKAPQAPRPAEAWPADLDALLRRVSTAFEWSSTDRRDFVAWSRRSPEGIQDARAFLLAECAKLPAPGLSDRRRVVLDMLAADPTIRHAWTCADDGADPVILTLAVRGTGTCDLAVPRERFDALSLPMLIAELTREDTP